MASSNSKLTRSSSDRVVAGICGGLAERLGWDVTLIRLIYVLFSIFTAGLPLTIIYIILWWIIPAD